LKTLIAAPQAIQTSEARRLDGLAFKLAKSKSELEQAFRLVAHCYLEKGYITESDAKLRIKLQHALPTAAIFVGKLGDRVVTTASVFPDSELGLPADSIFQAELDILRSQGRKLAELGALASNLESDSSPLNVPLHILQAIRLTYLYGQDSLRADDLIITVNPKHRFFYEKVLCFELISETKFYPEVNQAPAIALRQDLHTIAARLAQLAGQKSRLRPLRDLFFGTKIVDLDILETRQVSNIWNADLLNYFFNQQTTLFQDLSPDKLDWIQRQHIALGLGDRSYSANGTKKP
jgi:hypothetical protein